MTPSANHPPEKWTPIYPRTDVWANKEFRFDVDVGSNHPQYVALLLADETGGTRISKTGGGAGIYTTKHSFKVSYGSLLFALQTSKPGKEFLEQLQSETVEKCMKSVEIASLWNSTVAKQIEEARADERKKILSFIEKEIAECVIRENKTEGYEFNRQCGIHCGLNVVRKELEQPVEDDFCKCRTPDVPFSICKSCLSCHKKLKPSVEMSNSECKSSTNETKERK